MCKFGVTSIHWYIVGDFLGVRPIHCPLKYIVKYLREKVKAANCYVVMQGAGLALASFGSSRNLPRWRRRFRDEPNEHLRRKVRALGSHQCGLSSSPEPGVTCEMSLVLVLVLAPMVFLCVLRYFVPPQKPTLLFPIRSTSTYLL